jgi:hypothetical protein
MCKSNIFLGEVWKTLIFKVNTFLGARQKGMVVRVMLYIWQNAYWSEICLQWRPVAAFFIKQSEEGRLKKLRIQRHVKNEWNIITIRLISRRNLLILWLNLLTISATNPRNHVLEYWLHTSNAKQVLRIYLLSDCNNTSTKSCFLKTPAFRLRFSDDQPTYSTLNAAITDIGLSGMLY